MVVGLKMSKATFLGMEAFWMFSRLPRGGFHYRNTTGHETNKRTAYKENHEHTKRHTHTHPKTFILLESPNMPKPHSQNVSPVFPPCAEHPQKGR